MGRTLRTFACAGAMLVLLTAAATAQAINMDSNGMSLSPFKQQEKKPLTPDELERQQKLDDAYKAATNKIPDQKSNDPWAVVRPAAPAPAPKKKPQ